MIRKLIVVVEQTLEEAGQQLPVPVRKAAAIAVIANPFAGRYEANLEALIETGASLGAELGRRAVEALGIAPGDVQSYGKAAIVGEDGELEHAAAILHPKLGAPLRVEVGGGAALVAKRKEARRHGGRDRRAAGP